MYRILVLADWKHIANTSDPGAIIGCDFCGIVEEVGEKVTAKVKKGDRIAGFSHGGNKVRFRSLVTTFPWSFVPHLPFSHPPLVPEKFGFPLFAVLDTQPALILSQSNHEDGCFATYAMAKDGLFLHPPPSMPDTDAATLGVGVITVGQTLYQSLDLPSPTAPASQPFSILIYGGSSATGALAIQYAKLSGAHVITTASKHNFDYLTGLGADKCFDYRDPDVGQKIREYAPELRLALDTISTEQTARICGEALAPSAAERQAKLTFIGPAEAPRKDIRSEMTLGYTAVGEAFDWRGGKRIEVQPGHWEFARDFWALSEGLFAEGKLKVHRPEVRKGGLEGVMQGLEDLKEGRVSGVKLVYEF